MIKNSEFTYRGVAASALILAFALHTTHVSAAETCVSAPTCAELGYTLTSTTNCVGTALKCPFDTTKYYCTTAPNFNTGRTLPLRINNTLTESGWLYAGAANGSLRGAEYKAIWYINGEAVGTHLGEQDENTAWYPVAKGDIVRHSGVAEYNYFRFYPARTN